MTTGHLWLIGMMGSGKSTAGRLVAAQAAAPFIDTDSLVELREGRPIASIFADDGEGAFRAAEHEVVRDVAAGREPAVVATGGGVVLDPRNVELMRQTGLVVWLDTASPTLVDRVGADDTRPLASGAEAIEQLASARRGLYEAAAHHRVDTTAGGVAATVLALTEWWGA